MFPEPPCDSVLVDISDDFSSGVSATPRGPRNPDLGSGEPANFRHWQRRLSFPRLRGLRLHRRCPSRVRRLVICSEGITQRPLHLMFRTFALSSALSISVMRLLFANDLAR